MDTQHYVDSPKHSFAWLTTRIRLELTPQLFCTCTESTASDGCRESLVSNSCDQHCAPVYGDHVLVSLLLYLLRYAPVRNTWQLPEGKRWLVADVHVTSFCAGYSSKIDFVNLRVPSYGKVNVKRMFTSQSQLIYNLKTRSTVLCWKRV